MWSKNVFLDTSEFVGSSLNFSSKLFDSLTDKARRKRIKVYITKIVEQEVRNHIRQKAMNASSGIKEFQNNRIFRGLHTIMKPSFDELNALGHSDIEAQLIENFTKLIKDARIKILPISNVSIDSLAKAYFSQSPPFGGGDKKAEFPDAISMMALEAWTKKNSEKLLVVSRDDDVKQFCATRPTLKHVSTMGELLEMATQDELVEAKAISDFIVQNVHSLVDDIERNIPSIEISTYNEDEEPEFEDIEIEDVNLRNWHIILLTPKTLTLEIKARIQVSAEASRLDLQHAVYDPSDGTISEADRNNFSVNFSMTIEGTMDYFINIHPPKLWSDITLGQTRYSPDYIYLNLDDYD
jgi:hypothetical protein